jgi:hypothetical protein
MSDPEADYIPPSSSNYTFGGIRANDADEEPRGEGHATVAAGTSDIDRLASSEQARLLNAINPTSERPTESQGLATIDLTGVDSSEGPSRKRM